jgi:hypothetical protein
MPSECCRCTAPIGRVPTHCCALLFGTTSERCSGTRCECA